MEKEAILREILEQNTHWNGDSDFFESKKHSRRLFFELVKYLPDRQIISIVGLRRTGKTILLKQLIAHLIENNDVEAKQTFFLTFDEALVTSNLTLKNYLDTFLSSIPETKSKGVKYVFLDEIQYIEKWQHVLKRYYDTRTDIKFVVSGSSSLFLKKKTTESLAGRIYEFKLYPLNFDEFLELANVSPSLLAEYRKYSLAVGELTARYDQQEYDFFLAHSGDTLRGLFEEYLLYYQFPEMIPERDTNKIRKYISESVYKKTIEYDIPKLFGVEKIDELKFLFKMLVNENGSLLEFQSVASEIGIEENTLKKYLSYFEESFLIHLLYNHSKSFRKSKRLQKKTYIASPNFFTALRFDWDKSNVLKSEYLGILAETYIFNLLKEKYQYLSFYRKGKEEIDFVASNDYRNTDSHVVAEVKYTREIRWDDIKFIDKVAKKTFKTKYLVYSRASCKVDDIYKIIVPCFLIK